MSLIEKAVERLDQLKRADQVPGAEAAGISVPRDLGEPVKIEPVAVAEMSAATPAQGDVVSRSVSIDLSRLNGMGLVTPDNPRSAIAEEYRVVKRPLLKNASMNSAARVEDGNLIMVTSALPGEGKSFTALNLAISMAMELDHTVLLVDADVSKPSVLKTLGLPPERGLMDVLTNEDIRLPDVLLRTNIEKLAILPAGNTNQRATELLASEGMNRLLDEMSRRYADRIIIFDSPPLLVTTEARALATHMGQIVMVVEAERTTHSAVKQALATIDACPIKMMLLNKSTMQGPGGYYGYGYGYGYGYEDSGAGEQAA
ncbi:tyrosine-protein kinase family protein [Nitrogeniibacter mangrovi]|uniref:non-specific protein-tyrosine kinase n=1 Tax=Nitrogeniibacter mangrovi TaxID=2016596 RepID=A0A6C1B887_9RHOO|nr:XrtA-associated tyrosine autokinase [Nitrogeniibacter mangrovi]QID18550.1 tyrosine-protein kinase family protein [Nitrogeniibacter mangrovi]